VVDGQFVVKHGHLHELALQRAYVEMEIPHLLVLKIGHGEKFLRESLVQPPPSRRLSHYGDEALKKSVELDFGF
jgi:hypothetical protein